MTTKRQENQKRREALATEATEAFAAHEVRSRTADRVMIQRRHRDGGWEGHFAVELVLLRTGLLVYGDIAAVVFAHYEAPTLEAALAWLGGPLGSGYVAEKADIGMRMAFGRVDHVRLTYAHAAIRRARELLAAGATATASAGA